MTAAALQQAALAGALGLHPLHDALQAALYAPGHGGAVAFDDVIKGFQPQAEGLERQVVMRGDEHDESPGVIVPQLLRQFQAAHPAGKVDVQKVDGGHRGLALRLQQPVGGFQRPHGAHVAVKDQDLPADDLLQLLPDGRFIVTDVDWYHKRVSFPAHAAGMCSSCTNIPSLR